MSIVLRGATNWSTGAAAGSAAFSVALPAVVKNDLILIFTDPVIAKGCSPPSATYGAPVTSATAASNHAMSVYKRISDGTDGSVVTITAAAYAGTFDLDAVLLSFSGVDGTTPVDTSGSGNATTNTSLTANSITTARANEWVIAAYLYENASTFTPPAGMSVLKQVSLPNTTFDTMAVCGVLQAAAGASGNKVATIGTTSPYAWIMLAINPVISTPAFWTDKIKCTEVDA